MPPRRQVTELKRVLVPPGIEVVPDTEDLNVWHATITAPDEYTPRNDAAGAAAGAAAAPRPSPYAGRRLGVTLRFGEKYPFECPVPAFRPNALWHPMVDFESGNINLAFLHHVWGPRKMAVDVLMALRDALANMEGQVNGACVEQMATDVEAFEAKARAAAATEPSA